MRFFYTFLEKVLIKHNKRIMKLVVSVILGDKKMQRLLLAAIALLLAAAICREIPKLANHHMIRQSPAIRDTNPKPADLYGEPLPWKEVNKLFPRYAAANVIDVETGKSFEVERRGGTYHADIQPVSAQDTAVLKEIYQGEWSWKRRAVVLEIGRRRIAASINGMPHGQGKIKGNNFPGHFCIHFLQSRVHASSKVDKAHQMMIWKAAGQPEKPFLQAGPAEVVELVFIALNQGDGGLASGGLAYDETGLWLLYRHLVDQLPAISLERLSLLEKESTSDKKHYHARLAVSYPGETKPRKLAGVLVVIKNHLGIWKLAGEGLKQILDDDA